MASQTASPNTVSVEIDDNVKRYLFLTVMLVSAITVVGIPFIPFIAIIYWVWYAPRYREFHTLELTETGVQSKRGVVFRSETNVPLERITDVSVHQGPLMRWVGVHEVRIESAGQTQQQGAVSIVGVVEPYRFRDAVLYNVELAKAPTPADDTVIGTDAHVAVGDGESSGEQLQLLKEIRDLLSVIAAKS